MRFGIANGFRLASVYFRDDLGKWSFGHIHLTSDEARRIAMAIARLPEFLMQQRASISVKPPRWKPARPYHVALEDSYSFAEYAPEADPETKKKDIVWFAHGDDRPLSSFGMMPTFVSLASGEAANIPIALAIFCAGFCILLVLSALMVGETSGTALSA